MDDLELRRWKPDQPQASAAPKQFVLFACLGFAGLVLIAVVASMMGRPAADKGQASKPVVVATAAETRAEPATATVTRPAPVAAAAPRIKPDAAPAKPKAASPAAKKKVAKAKVKTKPKVKASAKKAAKKAPAKPAKKPAKAPAKKAAPVLDLDALAKSYTPSKPR